jgi:hypothetical protein
VKKIFVWIAPIIAVGLIGLSIYHWMTGIPWPDWTGFSDYTGPLTKDQRGKTLWDWMGLFIIPVVLAVSAYLFNRAEKANDLKIAELNGGGKMIRKLQKIDRGNRHYKIILTR